MDKKRKQMTPRMEKRLKWFQEQKSGQRITRAKAGTKESVPSSNHSSGVKTETSSRGFKSKFVQPVDPVKKSANNSVKKSFATKNNEKKNSINNNNNNEIAKNKGAQQEKKAEVKNSPDKSNKGNKKLFVDAVEKLENTTSVHTPKRFVLFVGNLPKNITKEQVEEHFKKTGGVKAVRIPKHKGTEESKGFAYVEFTSTISHRIALRLHNTTLSGRKINVEFTSEGKKTPKRMESLREKNEKLAKYKMPFDT